MHKENKIKENISCTENEEETLCCTWEVEMDLRRKHGEGEEVILHAWGERMKVIQPPKWKKMSLSCTYNIERRCVVHTREEKRLRHKEVMSQGKKCLYAGRSIKGGVTLHAQGKRGLYADRSPKRGNFVARTRKRRSWCRTSKGKMAMRSGHKVSVIYALEFSNHFTKINRTGLESSCLWGAYLAPAYVRLAHQMRSDKDLW